MLLLLRYCVSHKLLNCFCWLCIRNIDRRLVKNWIVFGQSLFVLLILTLTCLCVMQASIYLDTIIISNVHGSGHIRCVPKNPHHLLVPLILLGFNLFALVLKGLFVEGVASASFHILRLSLSTYVRLNRSKLP